jgi:predicted dehydrogenase
MSDAVRFGLVGYGFGGRVFHAPLLTSAANVEFAGVMTNDAERRERVLADHPGAATFGSLAEMAAAGVEAVTVSTPAATHAALAEEALGLGLATVVDKPFTMDLASAEAVVSRAREAGVLLSVYQNRRYDSDFRTVRRLIDDGQLGAIREKSYDYYKVERDW